MPAWTLALLPLLVMACGDKDGGGPGTTDPGDGGTGDGGTDGGTETVPPDECDDFAGQVICDEAGQAITCDDVGDVADVATCAEEELCLDATGCVSCGLELDAGLGADADVAGLVRFDPADIGEDFAARRFSMRPISISGDGSLTTGTLTVDLARDLAGGGLAVWSTDGDAVGMPLSLDVAELPLTLLVQGLVDGAEGSLSAAVDDCGADAATVDLRVGAWSELAGRSLRGFPWLEKVDAFTFSEQVQAGLDPAEHADRAGAEVDVYVVTHQSAEAWVADPTLTDAGGAVETVAIAGTSLRDDTWTVWARDLAVASGEIATGYDVVFDMDADGQLSPGDIFEGPGSDQPAFWAITDLTEAGPNEVTTSQYTGGAWLGQRTYYPADIEILVAEEGPRPLVMMSHGNGHDYTWYDYLGEHLASWGYVFMAHQNNTGPGIEACSRTTLTNTDWFVGNMSEIDDGVLVDNVDTKRIAWLGHSRGGEGVTRAYDLLVDGVYRPEYFDQDDIVLISSIAPTVFLGVQNSNPHDRWYHQLDAAGDGDVTGGPTSPVVQYLRIAEAAESTVAVDYVQGAAHNDFNCCGFGDGTGPDLIGRSAAQVAAKAIYLGLLEWVVEGNPATADLVRRQYESFHDGGISDDVVVAHQFRPDPYGDVLVLDDFQYEEDTTVSSAGTAVTSTVEDLVEGLLDDGNSTFSWESTDPMNGMTLAEASDDEARGAVFSWSTGTEATWRVDLAEDRRDVSAWTWLSLRACQGTRHPNTVMTGGPLTFGVTLIDGSGAEQSILLDDVGLSLTRPYQRSGTGTGRGWANEWNTVRLRVADFAADGAELDLTDIEAVELRFGEDWGSPQGRIGLDDLMFTAE